MNSKVFSALPRHIVLVNPTRYLGNLLIAGGLIQHFAAQCQAQGIGFTLVVDSLYAELLGPTLPPGTLLAYPRAAIKRASWAGKLRLYLGVLRQLRQLQADIAFNIEEDSTSDRLTRWSGAGQRIGCSSARHRRGYEQVLTIDFVARPEARRHRWYSFMEVFAALQLPEPAPGYLHFNRHSLPPAPLDSLRQQGFVVTRPYLAIHAGATKDYKKWPTAYFAQLARSLRSTGLQVVFIGAGRDAQETAAVFAILRQQGGSTGIFDATNQFSLAQLGGFLSQAHAMVGNDSGPFHLASALGVKGVVIFGPTDAGLWRPLGDRVRVLQRSSVCSPACSRKQCLRDHACLTAISPEEVLEALRALAVC